ncbi:MAG: 16S rRNA (cytidine(1402)-2'-O)-methyltransferase [Bacteroidales bacterium]|nr:16S rRNA (cytidine(1402)-2'-O)-methyltransferase [Bacteroidales bacterium]
MILFIPFKMAKLSVVPVPIGNLKDITLRAIETLQNANLVVCEDTRQTSKLLKLLHLSPPPMISYHKENEHRRLDHLISIIKEKEHVALVSDAGTPGISDPGYLIIKACIEEKINVEVLPGPVAFIPVLVGSGLPIQRFYFEGFLPHKKGRKQRLLFLSQLKNTTIVFYESPHRLLKLLEEIAHIFCGSTPICVGREVTKKYEEFFRGSVMDALNYFKAKQIRGEITVVLYNE